MEIEDEKIYSHHVPRFYLRVWAVDERIWWSGYGRIRQSQLTVVGGENYFYRLDELGPQDIFHLKQLMKTFPVGSQESCDLFLLAFTLPLVVKQNLREMEERSESESEEPDQREIRGVGPEDILLVDRAISNTGENYHTAVENLFRPYLESMLKGSPSFYESPESAAEFLYALSLQYLRTKKIRESVLSMMQTLFENIGGGWNILSQMLAVTMGASLFADRQNFRIVLIDNGTGVSFITGDQPIVNLLSDPTSSDGPERMELYYPLSPTKGMLYLEKSNPWFSGRSSVTLEEAREFNQLIQAHAYQQLFASSEDSLKLMQQKK